MQIMFAVVTERILREYREYWHGAKPVLSKKIIMGITSSI